MNFRIGDVLMLTKYNRGFIVDERIVENQGSAAFLRREWLIGREVQFNRRTNVLEYGRPCKCLPGVAEQYTYLGNMETNAAFTMQNIKRCFE